MDFESWWKKSLLEGSVHMSYYLDAEAAWKAATLAERERVLTLVESMYDRNMTLDWNDALEEVSFALRDHV